MQTGALFDGVIPKALKPFVPSAGTLCQLTVSGLQNNKNLLEIPPRILFYSPNSNKSASVVKD
jgi:hypothetical protein